jgi:hypothetical protein
MKIEVDLKKNYFFSLLAVLIVLSGALIVYAYNSSPGDASKFGHSANELEVNIGGVNYTLQQAISSGLLGNGSGGSSNALIKRGTKAVQINNANSAVSSVSFSDYGLSNFADAGYTLSLTTSALCRSNGDCSAGLAFDPHYINATKTTSGFNFWLVDNQNAAWTGTIYVDWIAISATTSAASSGGARINYSDCTGVGGVKASCGMNCPTGYVMTGFQTGVSCGYPPANGDTLWQSSMTCCRLI